MRDICEASVARYWKTDGRDCDKVGRQWRCPILSTSRSPVFFILLIAAMLVAWVRRIHTELIGRMPCWSEAVTNAPLHHRVHHAVNTAYLDRNYAGVFIIGDRLFGTFVAERGEDRPRHGIVTPLNSFNPFWAAFHE